MIYWFGVCREALRVRATNVNELRTLSRDNLIIRGFPGHCISLSLSLLHRGQGQGSHTTMSDPIRDRVGQSRTGLPLVPARSPPFTTTTIFSAYLGVARIGKCCQMPLNSRPTHRDMFHQLAKGHAFATAMLIESVQHLLASRRRKCCRDVPSGTANVGSALTEDYSADERISTIESRSPSDPAIHTAPCCQVPTKCRQS